RHGYRTGAKIVLGCIVTIAESRRLTSHTISGRGREGAWLQGGRADYTRAMHRSVGAVRCIAWLGVGLNSSAISTRSQECEHDRYNKQRRNVADQMSMTVWGKCLHRHDAAVNHARPHSKPNE